MQVEHHLIDEIDPFQQFTVLDFQKKALESVLLKEILHCKFKIHFHSFIRSILF